jgi:hypothetical protein
MKPHAIRTILMVVALVALASGCHHFGTRDSYRGYGYSSYREDYRDGRNYDSQRDNWRDRRGDSWSRR